jgi:hypothetical protein
MEIEKLRAKIQSLAKTIPTNTLLAMAVDRRMGMASAREFFGPEPSEEVLDRLVDMAIEVLYAELVRRNDKPNIVKGMMENPKELEMTIRCSLEYMSTKEIKSLRTAPPEMVTELATAILGCSEEEGKAFFSEALKIFDQILEERARE